MKTVARIRTDLPGKFGIPRQSGIVEELEGLVVFEPEYRVPEAVRGIEGFTHLWLIWGFSEVGDRDWSPTVRPPRLGGNKRMGVFATRSPFRPNPVGLSCVKLLGVEKTPEGLALRVGGADLMDGTPIYDIKPYVPMTDCRPEAAGGFTDTDPWETLEVVIPPELMAMIPEGKRRALTAVLAQDPRPAYQEDPERIYGFTFAGAEVRFRVEGKRLTVVEVESAGP